MALCILQHDPSAKEWCESSIPEDTLSDLKIEAVHAYCLDNWMTWVKQLPSSNGEFLFYFGFTSAMPATLEISTPFTVYVDYGSDDVEHETILSLYCDGRDLFFYDGEDRIDSDNKKIDIGTMYGISFEKSPEIPEDKSSLILSIYDVDGDGAPSFQSTFMIDE